MTDQKEWFAEWFNDEYLDLYRGRDYSAAAQEIKALVEILRNIRGESKPISKVLDVACGAGRHAAELAQYFPEVVGIDLSETLLQRAREHAEKSPPHRKRVLQFIRADMRSLPFEPQSFDLLTSLFNSFGYFNTDGEHVALLREWNRVLRPSGVLTLDYFHRDYVIQSLVPRSTEIRGEVMYEITREMSEDFKRVEKTIRRISAAGEKLFHESVRLYSPKEVASLVESAGLTVVSRLNGFSSEEFSETSSKQLLLVAQKIS